MVHGNQASDRLKTTEPLIQKHHKNHNLCMVQPFLIVSGSLMDRGTLTCETPTG